MYWEVIQPLTQKRMVLKSINTPKAIRKVISGEMDTSRFK